MAVMRVRLPDDVVVEVDSAEDAVRVQQAYARIRRVAPTSPVRESVPLSAVVSTPLSAAISVVSAHLPQRQDAARVIFKNGHYPGFQALVAAGDAGVDSDQLVAHLGLPGLKSLPPTLSAWGKRAKALGFELSMLLNVDRGYLHGKPHTIYRLTDAGYAVLAPGITKPNVRSDLGLELGEASPAEVG
jgi:hypothetical protein